MRRSSFLFALALVGVLFAAASAVAQTTIGTVHPRSCLPGQTTQVFVAGKGFDDRLRVAASHAGVEVTIAAVEPELVKLDVTVPADASLGPLGIWLAAAAGPLQPLVVLVDDLPTVAEAADNTSPASAQPLESLAAVDGVSKGANSAFYRITVAAGQRIAVEVLTQPLGSTMDPVVRLLDAEGQVLLLADDDAVGPDCRFAYQFSDAGDYLIQVGDNRYAAGGTYRLRVGDFPILSHAMPLAVTAGRTTSVAFHGPDGELAEPREVNPAADSDTITTIATRLPEGRSSAWVPLRVSPLPQAELAAAAAEPADAETTDDAAPAGDAEATIAPLNPPVVIQGQLASAGQADRFPIVGTQGTTIRLRALTRSLACPTLLRMRLWSPEGAVVAETKVEPSDEWRLDYAFPADGVYQLELDDLLGRGGDGFGYAVEIIPAGTFELQLKPDAAITQQFAMEPDRGAAAIDLQVQRFGYDGEIELSFATPIDGLRILNPRIAAGAAEARIYVVADPGWAESSLSPLRLRGQAVDDPANVAEVNSLAWLRVKQPHVPFPILWNSGSFVLGGVSAAPDYFTLEPATPPRFARPLSTHPLTLQLKRTDEAFKGALTLIPDALPNGWKAEIKVDQDSYSATWTDTAESKAAGYPESLRLLAFSEHQNRGRIETIEVKPQWYDPLAVTVGPPESDDSAAFAARLVAGQPTKLVVRIVRDGGDPQPITLTFDPALAARGIRPPETLTIPADQDLIEFQVDVADDLVSATAEGVLETVSLGFTAASSHQGQEFSVAGQSAPLTVIPKPQSLEIEPHEISLAGSKDRRQVVVTGYDVVDVPRDWTADARLTSADPSIVEVRGSVVFARGNGQTEVVVEVGGERHAIPVRVSGCDQPWRTAFESEVLVALSKQGCNSGACHGSPSGKGMFRLSLRAFDAKLDELTLIREDYGRRLNPIAPEQSLLLLKPMMRVSHGGGKQIKPDDEAYAILHDWITEGAQPDPEGTARCVRLEVSPSAKRVLRLEAGPQQIAAVAHFSDGSSRDVTHLVAYESSDTSVAEVAEDGLVTPHKRGEAVILVRFLEHIESVPLMFIQRIPDFVWNEPVEQNYVDQLVNAKLKQLQFVPAETCTDAEFLRRVHLDLVGILPTLERTREFLADESADKRSRLIDELLERDEFAKFWALKWGDLLKMTNKGIGNDGIYKYHRWVEEAFRTNLPYDEFARQLLTTSGSTLANPPANFYRTATDMNECVENVSQVFLGARLQCAKCHNHPFERWTQDNYYGLGAFFNRVQRRTTQRPGEMFVYTSHSGEVTQPRTGETMKPWVPVAGSLDLEDDVDRRDAFAQWLIDPDNPYFAKMEANRIWAQLFSRGIVDPIDDFRDSNPPSNGSLLDALARDFADSGFDRRHLLRVILNSRTYQAGYRATKLNRDDSLYFSHQQPRLLSAEQLLDAINHTIGLEQTYGGLPPGTRATHLPAPDLVKVDFLKVFGQPERTTVCACERVDDSNLGMAIELFNGATIHEKIRSEASRYQRGLAAGQSPREAIEELYLAAFCRPPSEPELAAALAHVEAQESPQAGIEDIAWALLNTDEFLFQH